jgi:hypothetical protein
MLRVCSAVGSTTTRSQGLTGVDDDRDMARQALWGTPRTRGSRVERRLAIPRAALSLVRRQQGAGRGFDMNSACSCGPAPPRHRRSHGLCHMGPWVCLPPSCVSFLLASPGRSATTPSRRLPASSLTTLIIVSDHAEPRVLTQQQPFDTEAVEQALGFL